MASRLALVAAFEACTSSLSQQTTRTVRASLRPRHMARQVPVRTFTKWFSTKQPLQSDDKTDPKADAAASHEQDDINAAQQEAVDVDGAAHEATLSPEQVAAMTAELEQVKTAAADHKDKYLRALAEMENLRERSKREISDARDFAMHKFAKDLLEFVDNLERAMEYVPKEELEGDKNLPLKHLYDGLDGTYNQLHTVFQRHGIEKIDPKGDKFDPELVSRRFLTSVRYDGYPTCTVQYEGVHLVTR
eukprot:m.101490 g.101490  ORF g.101490 m.101490 type:complete len:247 (+) comp15173_c0_seq2:113-853(+)